jgi:hypothetical protein
MSLTSYRAAPPRAKWVRQMKRTKDDNGGRLKRGPPAIYSMIPKSCRLFGIRSCGQSHSRCDLGKAQRFFKSYAGDDLKVSHPKLGSMARARAGYEKSSCSNVNEDFLAFGRPGNDLLSQVLRHSTIGAKAFDGRVRDGIGSNHSAKVTRPAKRKDLKQTGLVRRAHVLCASSHPKSLHPSRRELRSLLRMRFRDDASMGID